MRTDDLGRASEQVGTYQHPATEDLKSNDVIKVGADRYRVVFFVHTEPRRGGGNLVVIPTD